MMLIVDKKNAADLVIHQIKIAPRQPGTADTLGKE